MPVLQTLYRLTVLAPKRGSDSMPRGACRVNS